jgi:hypothetical protein
MSIKTTKRLALGVIASLVFAPLAAIAPASANATGTAAITPVRVSFTGDTQHVVAGAAVTITPTGATTNAVAAAAAGTRLLNTVALTVAPSATATLTIAQANVLDAAAASLAVTASGTVTLAQSRTLTAASTEEAITTAAAIGGITFKVNEAGTYSGTITTVQTTGSLVTPFTFTTRGAPASYTVVSNTTTLNRLGVATFTVTVLDAAGNRTQVSTSDTMTVTATTGTIASSPLTAANLSDGIDTFTLTAADADGSSTVTVTPLGTLPGQGLAASTTVITVSGAINATAVTAIAVSVPAVAVTAGTPITAVTAAVPTGTSAVTVTVTGAVSSVLRFRLVASAGTLNGLSTPLTQFVNVTTDTTGKGSMSATLGGAALVTGATLTITQVDGGNTNVGAGGAVVITQTDPTVSPASITQSPGTAETAKLGDTVNVTVTVEDQFGNAIPGMTVRAFRGTTTAGTLLDTKTTAANGTAVVALTNAATLVAGSSETYSFSAQAITGAAIADNAALVITYTATGVISEISVASALAGTTTPLLASQSTPVAVMPSVLVPTDGTANAAATGTFIVATGLAGVAAGGEVVQFTPTTTTATNVTVTASAGAFVSKTASTAWNKGSASVLVPSGIAVYAFATKVGTHTLTFTAGGKTVTAQFRAANTATDFYNIAISPATASVQTGSNNVVVVTVTDVFGNPVNAAAGDVVVTTSAPTTVLMGGFNSSTSVDVGAAGTANVLYLATDRAGSATLTATAGVATNAWLATYVPPTGAPAPIKSATATITVTEKPKEIVYEKPTLSFVKDGGRIILSGTAENGEGDIIIYTKRVGTTAWKERAKTLEVAAPGDYNGSIKAPKNSVVIRVKQEGTGLFSNQIIVLK